MDFNAVKLTPQPKNNLEIKELSNRDMAIIGMSGRFSHANDLDEFWRNLKDGVDCIGEFPMTRQKDTDQFFQHQGWEKIHYFQGAFLDHIDQFDYSFFRLSPKEASLMSPNQRLFLETVWRAIEDAGYGGKKLTGSKTGVYLGFEADAPYDYKRLIAELDPDSIPLAVPGNLTPIIASRISYLLDLHGPSLSVDTACSSSLVAVHLACQAIRNGECDLALAGSVRINLMPVEGQLQLGIESSDGRAHSFDDSADGTGNGEGVAVIFLKQLTKALKDNDQIYAVIKGSAVNQDGSSIGITAPNVLAQEDVIVNAWKDAGIDPETISYIEAHGTGTRLGDPIEIEGIQRAFRKFTDKKQFCALGTVKTNLGHLDNAAGMAGLIKAAQSLRAKLIPPLLHFQRPNRQIGFEQSPVYINDRVTDWVSNGSPRRCGISSFGFSGTNCHMILEEAPVGEEHSAASFPEILTLSAKSKEALLELITQYTNWIHQKSLPEVADICYTANTGRGHYNHRLAVIIKEEPEFKKKLHLLQAVVLNESKYGEIYYSQYQIVPPTKDSRKDGELTEAESKALSLKADLKLKEYLASDPKNIEILNELCVLYVKGAEVNWEEKYARESRRRVSLPGYAFERKRCWIEANPVGIKVNPSGETNKGKTIGKPLLARRLVESMEFDVYETEFSVKNHWVLNEHQIMNNYVMVGTAYLEMALEACGQRFVNHTIEFNNIVFMAPLIMQKDEQRAVQLILKSNDGMSEFSVISKSPENDPNQVQWLKHIEGTIKLINIQSKQKVTLQELQRRLDKDLTVPNFDEYNQTTVFNLGLRWNNIRQLWAAADELLSFIELPAAFWAELTDYTLYPSLLDNALTTIPLLQKAIGYNPVGENQEIFLPFCYQSMRVHRPVPAKFYSWVKLKEPVTLNAEMISFDVSLFDLNGDLLVEIEGYSLKKVPPRRINQRPEDEIKGNLYYRLGWAPQDLSSQPTAFPPGNILILKDDQGFGDELVRELSQKQRKVFEAQWGQGYQKVDGRQYLISGREQDYELLLADLRDQNITQIIHLLTITNEAPPQDMDSLKESQIKGVMSLFYLARAIPKIKENWGIRIALISKYVNEVTGREEILIPENATLFGLGNVINQEYAGISCKLIDVDSEALGADLLAEINDSESRQVAYRNGRRYIPEFQRCDIKPIPSQGLSFQSEGVYLITGGAGGIGLEIAKYLAAQNKINLALINRSKPPERTKWPEILKSGTDPKTLRTIRIIQEIESNGSVVQCYSGDVSAYDSMKKMITELRQTFGKIRGVIHSAGIAGDGFIVNRNEASFCEVMAPKVTGTWIIEELTRNDNPDFLVMFSSVITLTGAPGQGDYTAANAYQDSFAAFRARQGRKTLTINWPGWKETGMAFDYGVSDNGFFKMIAPSQAVQEFDKVIRGNMSRIIIGELNYQSKLLAGKDQFSVQLSPQLQREISRWGAGATNREQPPTAAIRLKGKVNGVYSTTEIEVAQVFGKILGLPEIDIYHSFYDLGGDSLFGIRVINKVNVQLGITAEIIDLFKYPSVNEFAARLESKYINRGPAHNGEALIQKIPEKEFYPVSSAQKRIYLAHLVGEASNTAYNISLTMMIEGRIDHDKLGKAFIMLIDRHETLRTSFEMIEGEIVQQVRKRDDFHIMNLKAEESAVEGVLQELIQPFNLNKPPLLRAGLIELSAEKCILLIDIHHIIADGVSLGILARDMVALYNGSQLPELKIQYKDYAVWQNNWLRSQGMIQQEAYWLRRLDGFSYTEAPKRNRGFGARTASKQLAFETETIQRMNQYCRENNITKYVLLLAVFNLILYREINQTDLTIGTPIAGRGNIELENLIGIFINVLMIRTVINQDLTFKELLGIIHETVMEAQNNQDYPYEELYARITEKGHFQGKMLFSILFNYLPPQDNRTLHIVDAVIKPYQREEMYARFDVTLYVYDHSQELSLKLLYRRDDIEEYQVDRILNSFKTVVNTVLAADDLPLKDINIEDNLQLSEIGSDFEDYFDNEEFL